MAPGQNRGQGPGAGIAKAPVGQGSEGAPARADRAALIAEVQKITARRFFGD